MGFSLNNKEIMEMQIVLLILFSVKSNAKRIDALPSILFGQII